MSDKLMTPAECIEMLSNELQDEAARADSYRKTLIQFADMIAENHVAASKQSRQQKFKIINMPEPPTGSVN